MEKSPQLSELLLNKPAAFPPPVITAHEEICLVRRLSAILRMAQALQAAKTGNEEDELVSAATEGLIAGTASDVLSLLGLSPVHHILPKRHKDLPVPASEERRYRLYQLRQMAADAFDAHKFLDELDVQRATSQTDYALTQRISFALQQIRKIERKDRHLLKLELANRILEILGTRPRGEGKYSFTMEFEVGDNGAVKDAGRHFTLRHHVKEEKPIPADAELYMAWKVGDHYGIALIPFLGLPDLTRKTMIKHSREMHLRVMAGQGTAPAHELTFQQELEKLLGNWFPHDADTILRLGSGNYFALKQELIKKFLNEVTPFNTTTPSKVLSFLKDVEIRLNARPFCKLFRFTPRDSIYGDGLIQENICVRLRDAIFAYVSTPYWAEQLDDLSVTVSLDESPAVNPAK